MSNIAHLYKITNSLTGEYYIGKHLGLTQKSFDGRLYWGSGKILKGKIKKNGIADLKYEVLVIGSETYIYDLEKQMVTVDIIENDPKCMNLTIGGNGPSYHKEETKKLIGEKVKAAYLNDPTYKERVKVGFQKAIQNPKVRAKLGQGARGRTLSDEWKQKQSRRLKEAYATNPDLRHRVGSGSRGKKVSDETKLKISLANTGKVRSEETKAKIREARKNQTIPKEAYERQAKVLASLVWVNDGVKNYRISPTLVEEKLLNGLRLGHLKPPINEEERQRSRERALRQWQNVKNTGHAGPLIKV